VEAKGGGSANKWKAKEKDEGKCGGESRNESRKASEVH
jgi:hypothetical protein